MSSDAEQKAREAVRRAQAQYDQNAKAVKAARREAFADAQAAGLSLRQIAEEVGLHHSRVADIINGE